jgi:hypothetical protein
MNQLEDGQDNNDQLVEDDGERVERAVAVDRGGA